MICICAQSTRISTKSSRLEAVVTDEVKVVTNHHRREIIEAFQLTDDERKEFNYLDWPAIEAGRDSATFVRYKGELIDLGDLEQMTFPSKTFKGWDAYRSDSFFSGLVFKHIQVDYGDWCVIVGRYYS